MPVIFGAIRLARFNVQLVGFDKDHFNGLPIPMQAITVCAYLFQYYSVNAGLTGWTRSGLTILVILLSLLMVSRVKYDTLPKFSKRQLKANPGKVIGILIGSLIIIFSKGTLLFLLLFLYVLFGIARSVVLWIKRTINKTEDESEESGEFSSIDI
jgi:CDP-diacylglycerol--serine O-phosphatidyltransferase